jgi:hypothetical protein
MTCFGCISFAMYPLFPDLSKPLLSFTDNLRKDIIRAEKKKIALKTSQTLDDRAQISVGIDVEGGRMSGNLLPDGTVKINIPDESSDSDDIWDDHDEDED